MLSPFLAEQGLRDEGGYWWFAASRVPFGGYKHNKSPLFCRAGSFLIASFYLASSNAAADRALPPCLFAVVSMLFSSKPASGCRHCGTTWMLTIAFATARSQSLSLKLFQVHIGQSILRVRGRRYPTLPKRDAQPDNSTSVFFLSEPNQLHMSQTRPSIAVCRRLLAFLGKEMLILVNAWKQTSQTRSFWLLDQDIAVISVRTNCRKDNSHVCFENIELRPRVWNCYQHRKPRHHRSNQYLVNRCFQ